MYCTDTCTLWVWRGLKGRCNQDTHGLSQLVWAANGESILQSTQHSQNIQPLTHLGDSKNQGPSYGPQNSRVLIKGLPKMGPKNFGNPHLDTVRAGSGPFSIPRGSRYLIIIMELGLKDHDSCGFWGLSP